MSFVTKKVVQEQASPDVPYYDVSPMDAKPTTVTSLSVLANQISKEIQYLDQTIESARKISDRKIQKIQDAATQAVIAEQEDTVALLNELNSMRAELLKLL